MAGLAASATPSAGRRAGEPVLAVHDLGRDFGGVHAVRGCSFAVAPVSIISLIGPNGAGKTTAFNVIGGLLRPSAGRVTIDGVDVAVAVVAGTLVAFDDTCTHRACPLSEGVFDERTVTCPCHKSRFDLRTGEPLNGPATEPIRVRRLSVDGEQLLIER